MIQIAGITLLTDEAGTPVQVNIDLTRHGEELAAFLRAHGLSATETDLQGTVPGSRLTPLYREAKEHTGIGVLYRPEARRGLRSEVAAALLRLPARHRAISEEEYTASLLATLERLLRSRRHSRREPAPDDYARYGRDMFWIRFRIQSDMSTLWCACYTLHETTVLVRYIGPAKMTK